MDYYSLGITCGFCGKPLILTSTEVEYHYRHCSMQQKLGVEIINDEKAIRAYGNGDIAYLTAVYCGGMKYGKGGIILLSSEATIADMAKFRMLPQLLGRKIGKANVLDVEGTADLMLPPYDENSCFSEIYSHARIAAFRLKGIADPCYLKRILTVRITKVIPTVALLAAYGDAAFNDFFSMGFFFDQFCNDEGTERAAELTDYLNNLMRFAAPDIYINPRMGDPEYLAGGLRGLENNYIDSETAVEFQKTMKKEKNRANISARELFGLMTAGQMRRSMSLYGFRHSGMKKQELTDFFASGKHVEKAITEMINVYEYDRLQELMDSDGVMFVHDGELDSSVVRLFQLGLAFCGRTEGGALTVFVPREFLFLYRRLLNDEQVTRAYDRKILLEKRLNGILYAYGVLPVDRLFSIYRKIFRESPVLNTGSRDRQKELEEFRHFLRAEYAFWSQKTSVGRLFASDEEDFIFHENYWFPAKIRRRFLPRRLKPVTAEEVEAHGVREDAEYVASFDSVCADIWELLNLGDDASNIYMYMYNLMLFGLMQGGSPQGVFELLTRKMPVPFERVKYIFDVLEAEAPHMRQWLQGGYSADEIDRMKEKRHPRIKMSFQNGIK